MCLHRDGPTPFLSPPFIAKHQRRIMCQVRSGKHVAENAGGPQNLGRKKPVSRRKPGRAAHTGSLNLSHPDCLKAVALPKVSHIHVQLTIVDMCVFPAEHTVVPENCSGKNCLRLCYSWEPRLPSQSCCRKGRREEGRKKREEGKQGGKAAAVPSKLPGLSSEEIITLSNNSLWN